MITNLFINFILLVFGWVFTLLPPVTISSLPFIGDFLASTLLQMIKIWNAFLETFPYAKVGWDTFKYVIIPFEGLMLLGKFFLGSRMPSHSEN